MNANILRDLIPTALLKECRPEDNGRLEVAWRIYDALCRINQWDLSAEQKQLLNIEIKAAYRRWEAEGELMNLDGLQGPRGFAAAKREHWRRLAEGESAEGGGR